MSNRQCKICIHPNKLKMEREFIQGQPIIRVAQKYNVSYNSLYNHSQNHISRQLAQAWEKKDLDHSTDLLSRIDRIVDRAEKIFRRNYSAKKDSMALKALDSQRQTFELICKIQAYMHANKLDEDKEQKQINYLQQAEEMEQALKILTPEEMDLYFQLQMKIERQDKEMKIIQEKQAFSDVVNDSSNIVNKDATEETETPVQPMKRTKFKNESEAKALQRLGIKKSSVAGKDEKMPQIIFPEGERGRKIKEWKNIPEKGGRKY